MSNISSVLNQNRIPRDAVLFMILMASWSLFAVNPWLTLLSAVLLLVLFLLLWQTGEPPVLLFAVGSQWLQVSVPIFNANIAGIDMAVDSNLPNLDLAAFLGLLTLLYLAVGMRMGKGRKPLTVSVDVDRISVNKLIIAYMLSHAVVFVSNSIGELYPGLRQPLLALAIVHWMVVFVILWLGFSDKKFRLLATIVLGVEVMSGFTGFFSDFKFVLFIAILVSLGQLKRRPSLLQFGTLMIGGALIFLAMFWQAVKFEYRDFLNRGTQSQAVLVPVNERVDFLADRLVNITVEKLQKGFESGVRRTGYIEFFAHATNMVPKWIPYQEGRLWSEAVIHVLTPRLFFPDKGVIEDSERVREFTGLEVAGAEEGTSISLGYAAESYIDFGPYLMFLPILMLGFVIGRAYRILALTGRHRLLSMGLAVTFVLVVATNFGTANIKIVGALVTNFIGGWLVLVFFSGFLWRLISSGSRFGLAERP